MVSLVGQLRRLQSFAGQGALVEKFGCAKREVRGEFVWRGCEV